MIQQYGQNAHFSSTMKVNDVSRLYRAFQSMRSWFPTIKVDISNAFSHNQTGQRPSQRHHDGGRDIALKGIDDKSQNGLGMDSDTSLSDTC